MEVLRTPDSCFSDLPGYGFEPNYADVPDQDGGSLRMHYLDEGPGDGPIVLLLHGEPSWSFLYRHMIPVLTEAGLRAVAPDLVGFGRSDKPTPRTEYTFARHVEWMRSLLFDLLGLSEVTLVGQDWGGLIGLRLVGEHPDRFARVVAANTSLPTGDKPPGDAFRAWLKFSQEVETFPTGSIVNAGCTSDLSAEVMAGYDAPFPDQSYTEERASSRPSSPSPRPTRRPSPTARLGRSSRRSKGRSSPPSATATRSPPDPTGTCGTTSPGPAGRATRRSRAVATSCRRTAGPSWPPSWSISSAPPDLTTGTSPKPTTGAGSR